ncbi:MAG TPA: adenylate/guanylate cyclase domain-containing protein [Leptospiraceae bacterium]|nr:adenylate/guanylate cyclase domain-containing protein [Leptospiraceae bacterium]HMW07529.1 adenylate/guanylate cyclase domain-containing protein [Leptospiraceae bacterium]HMX33293.1 adenylate/guanylate cyclase domain-containing protein [Leptospiraceae bacterium]HMY33170.1 adenylate/guanylate cyclase domain-containing protein [Leptospiraceae bacterium]HMZ66789.1 adenylate/guanylate cyclase domain-containing protein [Leptospiraceae bacterium]
MEKFKFSVRFSIVTFSTLAVLLFGGLVSFVSYLGSKNSVRFLVDNLVEKASEHVIDKTVNYLDVAVVNTELNENLMNTGLVKIRKTRILEKYFQGVVETNPQLLSMFYGDEEGNFIMAKEMPDHSFSIQRIIRRGRKTKIIWEHQKEEWYEKEQFSNKIVPTEEAFNPKTRPWYTEALASKTHAWTDVYVFFNDRKPGITCSRAVYDKTGRFIGVIGIDISILELSEFLSNLKVGKNGKAFLIDAKNQIVAIPSSDPKDLEKIMQEETSPEGKKSIKLLTADKIDNPLISSSFKFYEENKDKPKEDGINFFEYSFKGIDYIANYRSFKKDDIEWKIAIVVPENDFMYIVHRNNKIILIISIVLVAFAVLFEIQFSQKLSKPLSLLSEEMRKIQNFDLTSEIQVGSFLLEVDNMAQSFTKMRTGLRSFKKYVPDELVRELIALNKEAILEGERRNMTIYFSDIAGFTSISEKLQPEELVEQLSQYLGSASKIITEHHGTLDKYIGDAIMAFWGAPTPIEDHALQACLSALEHKRVLKLANKELERLGKEPFNDRIGIHTGEVIVGNMGSENRLNYTVIGDNVNLASRLESINKYYGTEIIISESTYELVQDFVEVRILDLVAVKGKHNAIQIYELVCEKEETSLEIHKFILTFNEGVYQYRNRNFSDALKLFQETLRIKSSDLASRVYIERCENYIQNPPPENWNGVYESKSK